MTRPTKTMVSSRLETTTLMTPEWANFAGNIHGGHILRLVDQVAYACAARFSGQYCVTVSVDRVLFKVPVRVGDLVTMKAQVNRVGRSSMEVGVRVEAQDLKGGPVRYTNRCYLTMVAMLDGVAQEVPLLKAVTEEDHRRLDAAMLRREQSGLADRITQSSARHRDLIDLASVATLVIDVDSGQVRRANEAACKLLERARRDIVGAEVWELHPEEARVAARELWRVTVDDGFAEAELMHCTPNECRMLLVTSWQIPLPTGSLIHRVMRPV